MEDARQKAGQRGAAASHAASGTARLAARSEGWAEAMKREREQAEKGSNRG